MATQSPFSWLEDFWHGLALPPFLQPPAWLMEEAQRRVVLLLNHVLQREGEAMRRLAAQKGRVVLLQWRGYSVKLLATPAGLLDRADAQARPDLLLSLTDDSAWQVLKPILAGEKPGVRIEGDVQLAAEVNWLVDHVRWDLEEDLARLLGGAAAHTLVQTCAKVGTALRRFVARDSAAAADKAQP